MRSNEDARPRKFFNDIVWLIEVGRQEVVRIACDPLREIDSCIMAGIEGEQYAGDFGPDVFDGMAITLRNISDVSLIQGLDSVTAVRTEQSHVDAPLNDVLTVVRGRMPV